MLCFSADLYCFFSQQGVLEFIHFVQKEKFLESSSHIFLFYLKVAINFSCC